MHDDDTPETEDELRAWLRSIARIESVNSDEAGHPPRARVGDRLGRYQLLRELGRGGFGVVFAARDDELGREVAVKVMRERPDPDGTRKLDEELQREAAVVAGLRHPNIVVVHDWGRADDRSPYLVLELLVGETLADRLRRGPLPPDEAMRIALGIASGLAHAHTNGFIHRDLKPSNVFLVDESAGGGVKILDFGLARGHDTGASLSLSGRAGTPLYMAPEQRKAGVADTRSDVFSAGLVLLELFTGERLTLDEPVEAQRSARALPAFVRPVVFRALAADPGRRPLDGAALLAALEAAEASRRARPRRRWLAVALLLVIGLGAGASVLVRRYAQARARVAAALADELRRIEAELRFARLQPQHDIEPAEARARAQLASLASAPIEAGDYERGLRAIALGRGSLAVGDYEAAVAHFEAARPLGGGSAAEVDALLGEAMVRSWLAAEHELRVLGDEDWRKSRLAELSRTRRDPGLALLQKSGGAEPLVEALLALGNGDHAKTRALAARVRDERPWMYEADVLAADTYVREIHDLLTSHQVTGISALLEAGMAAAARARDVGRSDGAVYTIDCQLAHLSGMLAVESKGPADDGVFQRAASVCDRALAVSPHRVAILLTSSRLRVRRASRLRRDVPAMRKNFDEAQALLARAEEIAADSMPTLVERVDSAQFEAALRRQVGDDISATLDRGIAAGEKLIRIAPQHVMGTSFGNLLFVRAQRAIDAGTDPLPDLARAEVVLQLGPKQKYPVYQLLGRVLTLRAEYEGARDLDVDPALVRADAAYARAVELAPGFADLYDEWSAVLAQRAAVAHAAKRDAAPLIRRAIELGETALAKGGAGTAVHASNLGLTLTQAATEKRERHESPHAELDRAVALFEQSIKEAPSSQDTWFNLASAQLERARALLDEKRSPLGAIAEGRKAVARAVADGGDAALVMQLPLVQLDRVEGAWLASQGQSPISVYRRALVLVKRIAAHEATNAVTNELAANVALDLASTVAAPVAERREELAFARQLLARLPEKSARRASLAERLRTIEASVP